MNPAFICANCGKETLVSLGHKTSLVCQSCGCFDIKFNQDVLLTPANFGNINPENGLSVLKNEPFFGNTKDGFIWLVSEVAKEEDLGEEEVKKIIEEGTVSETEPQEEEKEPIKEVVEKKPPLKGKGKTLLKPSGKGKGQK